MPFETKNGWAYKEHKTIIDKILELRCPIEPEIWTTEGGTCSDFGGATERQQAADVVKRYIYSLAHGQSKLFWTRIVEYHWTNENEPDNMFNYTGLINNPENPDNKNFRKLSYYTYKKLVEAFTDADWRNILPVFDDDNGTLYVYRVPRHTRGALFIVWNDETYPGTVRFSGLTSYVNITEAVPPYNSGEDVEYEDYTNLFKVDTARTSNGELTISIGDSPLLIEEIPDTTPPTGTITINDNATYTNSAIVTLTLFAEDIESSVSQMRFSYDDVTYSIAEPYATSKSWPLSTDNSFTKTVFVKFSDEAGNWSNDISDSIIIDTVLPITTSSYISAEWYNKPVSVALSAMDAGSGIDKTYYSTNGANPNTLYTGSFTLSKDGVYTIKYYSVDKAGNKEGVKTDSNQVKIDTTPPTGTIKINGDAISTTSSSVTLNLSVTDRMGSGAFMMQFRNEEGIWSIGEIFNRTKRLGLSKGNGVKTVYARFSDKAGNVSGVVRDTIIKK